METADYPRYNLIFLVKKCNQLQIDGSRQRGRIHGNKPFLAIVSITSSILH